MLKNSAFQRRPKFLVDGLLTCESHNFIVTVSASNDAITIDINPQTSGVIRLMPLVRAFRTNKTQILMVYKFISTSFIRSEIRVSGKLILRHTQEDDRKVILPRDDRRLLVDFKGILKELVQQRLNRIRSKR